MPLDASAQSRARGDRGPRMASSARIMGRSRGTTKPWSATQQVTGSAARDDSQQTAKKLLLLHARTWAARESSVFTLHEGLWPKTRIMETYLTSPNGPRRFERRGCPGVSGKKQPSVDGEAHARDGIAKPRTISCGKARPLVARDSEVIATAWETCGRQPGRGSIPSSAEPRVAWIQRPRGARHRWPALPTWSASPVPPPAVPRAPRSADLGEKAPGFDIAAPTIPSLMPASPSQGRSRGALGVIDTSKRVPSTLVHAEAPARAAALRRCDWTLSNSTRGGDRALVSRKHRRVHGEWGRRSPNMETVRAAARRCGDPPRSAHRRRDRFISGRTDNRELALAASLGARLLRRDPWQNTAEDGVADKIAKFRPLRRPVPASHRAH